MTRLIPYLGLKVLLIYRRFLQTRHFRFTVLKSRLLTLQRSIVTYLWQTRLPGWKQAINVVLWRYQEPEDILSPWILCLRSSFLVPFQLPLCMFMASRGIINIVPFTSVYVW